MASFHSLRQFMELSVVIPAYNEEERIGPSIRAIQEYLKPRYSEYELIVVDDGSTDDTVNVARKEGDGNLRVLHCEKNLGKGAAVKRGMEAAKGGMVLFTDSDLSTPIEELEEFVELMEQGWDVVIASRNSPGAKKEVKQSPHRQFLGKGFPIFVRSMGFGKFSDTQCGFKLFRKEVLQSILPFQRRMGFAFDVELLFLAGKQGYRITERGVTWLDKEDSKVVLFRDGTYMLGELLRIRWDQLWGKYRDR